MENKSEIIIYESRDHQTKVEVKFDEESVWLTQKQMSALFEKNIMTVNEHIKNIYSEGELDENPTIRKSLIVQKEGKRSVTRDLLLYNLDVIISVGYRVNSKQGTQFRQWATQRLKDYLIQGYAINEKRLAEKQQQVEYMKTGIRILSRAIRQQATSGDSEVLQIFAKGLDLLDDYDHEELDQKGKTIQKTVYPEVEDYLQIIGKMKSAFSSDVFAKVKDKGFESSIKQIGQSFDNKDLYRSIEEKAATLLYLIVKNHSFVDGNKRIGAACFLFFLERNGMLFTEKSTPLLSNEALVALTLFVATSKVMKWK